MTDLKSLGYITISTNDIDRWRQFAFGALGFAEGSPSLRGPDSSALYLRMDERAARSSTLRYSADGSGPLPSAKPSTPKANCRQRSMSFVEIVM